MDEGVKEETPGSGAGPDDGFLQWQNSKLKQEKNQLLRQKKQLAQDKNQLRQEKNQLAEQKKSLHQQLAKSVMNNFELNLKILNLALELDKCTERTTVTPTPAS